MPRALRFKIILVYKKSITRIIQRQRICSQGSKINQRLSHTITKTIETTTTYFETVTDYENIYTTLVIYANDEGTARSEALRKQPASKVVCVKPHYKMMKGSWNKK